MVLKGSFRKCYIELLNYVGRQMGEDLAIIRLPEDDHYRLIYQSDLVQYAGQFAEQKVRVCCCMTYRELKVVVDGVQLPLMWGDK